MKVLITGAAGFIGMHVAQALLGRGEEVVGVDNLNSYYDPALKRARLKRLEENRGFAFIEADIDDEAAMQALAAAHPEIEGVVNVAAQAGVRYSLENPMSYGRSNLTGMLVMLEFCRRLPRLRHFVYASSSSVYGANTKLPYSTEDKTDSPVSLYAATKKSGELMAHAYSHLYGIPATGLRYFTVYGPWGRPDMAPWLFTDAILNGRPIRVFNEGRMRRDFTYIDDVTKATVAALDRPPSGGQGQAPHRVYNVGNHRSEELLHFIAVLEQALGKKAEMKLEPMQPGDVKETYADIEATRRDLGFDPSTTLEEGLPRFVEWFKRYHGM